MAAGVSRRRPFQHGFLSWAKRRGLAQFGRFVTVKKNVGLRRRRLSAHCLNGTTYRDVRYDDGSCFASRDYVDYPDRSRGLSVTMLT